MKFSIKDIVSKKGNYAFLCSDNTQFKMCVKQAFDEGIVFSKSLDLMGNSFDNTVFIEDYDYIISNYIAHLNNSNVCVLMKNVGNEIQFYSRNRSDTQGFDWSEWEIINWTTLNRNSKINEILSNIQ